MARFVFRFETLLKIREERERQQQRVVAARLREMEAVQRRRNRLLENIAEETSHLREAIRSEITEIDQIKLGRHWLIKLRRGVLEADAELSGHRAMLAQERAQLAAARTQTQVLSKLREGRRAAFFADLDRREQLELDDLSASRFARESMSAATMDDDSGRSIA